MKKRLWESDIVLDLAAGVAPIDRPGQKKTKAVYENDLNQEAVFYLKMKERQNKKANGGKRLAGVFNENATDGVSRMVRGVGGAFGGDALCHRFQLADRGLGNWTQRNSAQCLSHSPVLLSILLEISRFFIEALRSSLLLFALFLLIQ